MCYRPDCAQTGVIFTAAFLICTLGEPCVAACASESGSKSISSFTIVRSDVQTIASATYEIGAE